MTIYSDIALSVPISVQVNYQYSFLVILNFIPGITNPRPMQAVTVIKYE
jgi:hypothetical protein